MNISSIKYIIISPVRNEERYIKNTLDSVVSQTIRPLKWIIVNDGSSDKTEKIVNRYVLDNTWISIINIPDRGYYDLMSGGEVKAFLKGYGKIQKMDYDFLAKLDGDISFDKYYFENLFHEFLTNEKLGIASGACYYFTNDKLILEKSHENHVRGAARAYRKQCWDDIGGVEDELSWDAIDVYKARMLGWDTNSFENIKMIHHETTWAKGGILHGRMRSGRLQYLMGSHPLFFGLKVIGMILKKPFIIGSFAMAYGYIKSLFLNQNRVVDERLLAYIRKEQLQRLKRFIFLK